VFSLVGEPLSGDGCGSPITYSFSYFFLDIFLFIQFIVDIKWKVCSIQLNNYIIFFVKIAQSLVLPHLHRSRMQLLSHRTASVRCLLLTVSLFKSLSLCTQPLLPITNGS